MVILLKSGGNEVDIIKEQFSCNLDSRKPMLIM